MMINKIICRRLDLMDFLIDAPLPKYISYLLAQKIVATGVKTSVSSGTTKAARTSPNLRLLSDPDNPEYKRYMEEFERASKARENRRFSEQFNFRVASPSWADAVAPFAVTKSGETVVPKGAMLSGPDFISRLLVKADVDTLIAALVIIRAGAMSDVRTKVQIPTALFSDAENLDFHMDDVVKVAVKFIYEMIEDLIEKHQFDFKVGAANALPIRQVQDSCRKFAVNLNQQLATLNAGFALIIPAIELARLIASNKPEVVQFTLDHDLRSVFSLSPLAQWFENTNVLVFEQFRDLPSVYSTDFRKAPLIKLKRLEDYQEHQRLVVNILDSIYSVVDVTTMRNYFNCDRISIRKPGIQFSDAGLRDYAEMQIIQFLTLNLKSKTSNVVQTYYQLDEIPGTDLKLYGRGAEELTDVARLFEISLNNRLSRFEGPRTIAETNLHKSAVTDFDFFLCTEFVDATLACIFSDVSEDKGLIQYSFATLFDLIENVEVFDEQWNGDKRRTYKTRIPQTVLLYSAYDQLITSQQFLSVELKSTLPEVHHLEDPSGATYTSALVNDALEKKLKFLSIPDGHLASKHFQSWGPLIRASNATLAQFRTWDDISMPGDVAKLTTYRQLFNRLGLLMFEQGVSLYTLLDNIAWDQARQKYQFFVGCLSPDNLSDRLIFTQYANAVVTPVLQWIITRASTALLSARVLNPSVRMSGPYKLACFFLAQELLSFVGLEFSFDELCLIEPASLETRIAMNA